MFFPRVTTGSDRPIYRQVVDQIRLAVVGGKLRPGDSLPSVRAMAEHLLVNPNTIAKAYAELMREGFVQAQQGKGVFVADRRPVLSAAERQRRLQAAVEQLAHEAAGLGFSSKQIQEALAKKLGGMAGMGETEQKP
ncbi:MAG: GntR family transcriptional regulator [Phycisphaeraceae bacterium]|nr:GntR family transcriptional regulator [Phycisphaeraceae bacterium]